MILDFGDYTDEAIDIAKRSYEISSRIVKGDSYEDIIKKRAVIATGNVRVAKLIVFRGNPIERGIEALRIGTRIFCDVEMVRVGIRYDNVVSVVKNSKSKNRTRVYSGFIEVGEDLNDSIVVVGNSPSGAMAIYELVKRGIKPELVVATPVGFVNAARAKYLIRTLDIPSITTRGSIGGSSIAVSIINSIIDLHRER